jgi:REP element-mobilizing transposase RayT
MNERTTRRPPHVDLGTVPYFVSTRATDSTSPFVGDVAKSAVEQLLSDSEHYGFKVLAHVFMPDHAHFLLVPAPGRSISDTMRLVKGNIARAVKRSTKVDGAVWQEGFFDRVPRELEDLNACIRYVEANPVKAGLCLMPEAYPHSSAGGDCLAAYRAYLDEVRL